MEARGDRDAVRGHAVGLLRLTEVHAATTRAGEGAGDLDVEPDVLEGLGGVLEEVLVRVRHLKGREGASEGKGVSAGNRIKSNPNQ